MSLKIAATAIIMAVSCCGTAHAAEEASKSAISVTGTLAATSDYMFRGVSQTASKPAIQALIGVAHESGFYVEAWSSNVTNAINPHHIEVDLSGGYSKSFGSLTPDIGVVDYLYPGTNSRVLETYASIKNDFGPAALKLGVFYAPDQKDTDHNTNVYGEIAVPVKGSPFTLNGHVGYSTGGLSRDLGQQHYMDYMVGADLALGKFTFNLSFVDTDLKTKDRDETSRLVLTLTRAF